MSMTIAIINELSWVKTVDLTKKNVKFYNDAAAANN